MRRHQHRRRQSSSDSDSDYGEDEDDDEEEDEAEEGSAAARRRRRRMKMKCLSCKEDYDGDRDAGTCRECYEEAGETEEELKREIDDLKSKVNFLRLLSVGPGPAGPNSIIRPNTPCFSDVVLVASGSTEPSDSQCSSPSIPAHRAVLTSRSPVFKAMLENEMEESLSGTIKIGDVSYDALRAFVNYLYTAEACLDEHMACDLLVLAEKYQVKHLKTYCEKYLMSKLNWENSLPYYAFAHQHGAKSLIDAALSLIMDNMDKLSKQEEYMELVEKDPRVVVEIYEAYLSKQVNTAASKETSAKTG
ncbi:BTB/POZ domain-containing protein at4g08455 [Phtheirospermum japonicum]|uniref:BTB/POZ domain-containing protein at4g08455 n=1 Tax=Phtheirospermum japonicum TaxID=374723 RepID=A0A830AZW5_9LAMI|nr:BTB/POZ domain-containing protein at4g08455 [Phtheirospermum japonicum]